MGGVKHSLQLHYDAMGLAKAIMKNRGAPANQAHPGFNLKQQSTNN
jgi:hypothetical protein